jgi:hypothetical protein
VNFDIVTADVCVLRCLLATKPEANYLRFHARVDTVSAILHVQSTLYHIDLHKKDIGSRPGISTYGFIRAVNPMSVTHQIWVSSFMKSML